MLLMLDTLQHDSLMDDPMEEVGNALPSFDNRHSRCHTQRKMGSQTTHQLTARQNCSVGMWSGIQIRSKPSKDEI
jgi:hypothetical protein